MVVYINKIELYGPSDFVAYISKLLKRGQSYPHCRKGSLLDTVTHFDTIICNSQLLFYLHANVTIQNPSYNNIYTKHVHILFLFSETIVEFTYEKLYAQ